VVPVLCTSGTATTYFHGAVMEADLGRVPLLVLTADRPAELHGIGANQTVEQSRLYGTAVRWSHDLPAPEPTDEPGAWRDVVSRAVTECAGGEGIPAGPVHLNLALREPLVPVAGDAGYPRDLGLGGPRRTTRRHRDVFGVERVLEQELDAARTGVVVVGDAAGDPAPVVGWSEHARWPLIAEPHSNAREGATAIRAADVLLRDPGFTAANEPDLVVVVGRIGLSRGVQDWLRRVRHVVISPDGGNWDTTRSAAAVITASPAMLSRFYSDSRRADPQWLDGWQSAAKRAGAAVDALLDEGTELNEPRVARDVPRLLPAGAALVVGSSMPIRDLDLVMEPRGDITIYANRGVSGIDGFVSTAQGVAIGHDGPVVALCGDLSLLHDVNGLLPGPDPRPDLTYVVINNDGGGIFSLLPQADAVPAAAFERLFGTPHGLDLESLAAAYRIDYSRATTSADLATALSSYGGARLVEVRTDRAENAALHARMRGITAG
jgi:2-succinyl-5-enolpyruvyl-6-hydroxy-3-cyclohexene-1-carboxylate synthase